MRLKICKNVGDTKCPTFSDGTEIAMNQLLEFAGAANLTKLFDFSNNLGNVNTTLYELKSDTNRLRVYASQLNDGKFCLFY